ncbi:hypothetical protein EVG20_g1476 [Dentipellis fragilis]|uniref:Uncharacterized protein n=1 Tax=Dentipellis fragilis TaxID=205917 RepID=A0A4Y9ZCK3_9AGAM|nr:hypothetical protein EVG20_g1476 [Dentipellis fragilis]
MISSTHIPRRTASPHAISSRIAPPTCIPHTQNTERPLASFPSSAAPRAGAIVTGSRRSALRNRNVNAGTHGRAPNTGTALIPSRLRLRLHANRTYPLLTACSSLSPSLSLGASPGPRALHVHHHSILALGAVALNALLCFFCLLMSGVGCARVVVHRIQDSGLGIRCSSVCGARMACATRLCLYTSRAPHAMYPTPRAANLAKRRCRRVHMHLTGRTPPRRISEADHACAHARLNAQLLLTAPQTPTRVAGLGLRGTRLRPRGALVDSLLTEAPRARLPKSEVLVST